MSSSASATLARPAARAPAASPEQRWLVPAAFAVIYLVWGSTFLGIRVAVETLPPLSMAAVRFLVAGGVLLALSARARPRPSPGQWLRAGALGALFFLGNHGLVSSVAHQLPSGLVCLLIATEVPIIALLSAVLLPGQPLTRRSVVGALLGLCGVVALFWGQRADGVELLPCLAVLGASLSWGTGAVLSQRLDLPGHPLLRAGMQMSTGGLLLSLASLVKGEPAQLHLAAVSLRSLVALGYLIAFGSVLAFACYTFLLRRVRADQVATHVFVNPLVAVAVGAWLGGERLQPAHLVAGLCILASVCVIVFARRSVPPPTPARAEGEPAVTADTP